MGEREQVKGVKSRAEMARMFCLFYNNLTMGKNGFDRVKNGGLGLGLV